MVSFESLGTVCYSPSIVTIAVSAAILEIFGVKEGPDLEIWVWDPSRSFRISVSRVIRYIRDGRTDKTNA